MYRNILVPINLDEPDASARSLAAAATLASAFGASLTLMTALPAWGLATRAERSSGAVRLILDSAKARLSALRHGIEKVPHIRCRVELGGVFWSILSSAHAVEADLIVVTARRRRWRDILFGTTVDRVARRAPCSVFVVRD